MSKDKYMQYALELFDILAAFIHVYIDLNIKDTVETTTLTHRMC